MKLTNERTLQECTRALPRKRGPALACGALAAVAALGAGPAGAAEQFPSRPIRVVVAAAPGSGPDVMARQIGITLTDLIGQQIVVDARPGASGLIGAELVANATPDGHTVWLATMTQLISTTLHRKFMMATDYEPVGKIATTTFVLAASSTLPAKNVAEMIQYAKAHPGKVLYASGGTGSTPHLCMEMFKQMTGTDLLHVPYKSQAFSMGDMVSGRVQLGCIAAPAWPSFQKTGKVHALAVTSGARTPLVPGLAPVADTVAGFDLPGWYGMVAPRGTPQAVIARLNAAVNESLRKAELADRLFKLGSEASPTTPAEFGTFLKKETDRWAKLLKEVGIKPGK